MQTCHLCERIARSLLGPLGYAFVDLPRLMSKGGGKDCDDLDETTDSAWWRGMMTDLRINDGIIRATKEAGRMGVGSRAWEDGRRELEGMNVDLTGFRQCK